ncbi:MAG: isochorismatase family protein [Parvibaculales bacterium]
MSNEKLGSKSIALGDKPALIIVDASNGFTDPQSPLGADFSAEIVVINQLLEEASKHGWPVYCSSVVYKDPSEAAVFRAKIPALNILAAGSAMVELDPRLNLPADYKLVEKWHASCFHGTDLQQQLEAASIDSLIVVGFTTSGCVRATAVDGLQGGFKTVIISDGSGDRDAEAHRANLSDFGCKYGEVMTFEQLRAQL